MADPFLDEDGDETESNPVQDQRNHIKELEKAIKAAEKRAGEAETRATQMEATRRSDQAANYFKAAGLSEKFAGLYLTANPDAEVTEENVKAFATDYGLQPAEEVESSPGPLEQAPVASFVPVPGGTNQTMLSHDQYKELMKTDPARAFAYVQQGLVDLPGIQQTTDLTGAPIIEGSWVR